MSIDELTPSATSDVLRCSDPSIPSDGRNLVIKALNLFRAKTGTRTFFEVDLKKRVPHGAGLGGGSGNAATALWGANEVSGRPASNEQLQEWSGEIGSDISVFFSNGAAYCTGRGEVVDDVPPPLPLTTPLLLVKPPIGLSTPQIFRALDLNRRSTAEPRALLAQLAAGGKLAPDLVVNDLEQPAFDTLPELQKLKQQLEAEGSYDAVWMTGSGSTIVCGGGGAGGALPAFLGGEHGLFVSGARLITRRPGEWYTMGSGAGVPAEVAASAAAAS